MASDTEKLAESREILFGVSQALWTIAAVLRDREMPETARSVSDLAEMTCEFSTRSEKSA